MPTMSLKSHPSAIECAAHPTPELGKPLFRGTGDTDYLCGNCGSAIATSLGPTSASLSTSLSVSCAGRKTSSRLTCEREPRPR
jgi:hypothetical protein